MTDLEVIKKILSFTDSNIDDFGWAAIVAMREAVGIHAQEAYDQGYAQGDLEGHNSAYSAWAGEGGAR